MVAPHIMRELVTQHAAHVRIQPKPVVAVRAEAQADRLPRVLVEPEQVRLLVRRELGEQPDGEAVRAHDVPHGGVVCEPCEERARGVGAREVREGLDPVEGVLRIRGG